MAMAGRSRAAGRCSMPTGSDWIAWPPGSMPSLPLARTRACGRHRLWLNWQRRGRASPRPPRPTRPEDRAMLEVDSPRDLTAHIGKSLDPGAWLLVDQAMINAFADATGDHQWIHVDIERAKRELPGGKTIAHGFLTLSLLPRLAQSVVNVKGRSRGLNYGSNRVRFTGQVPAGSRIRLRQKIKSVEPVAGGGVRITSESTVEVEGAERPALVAETISMQFE